MLEESSRRAMPGQHNHSGSDLRPPEFHRPGLLQLCQHTRQRGVLCSGCISGLGPLQGCTIAGIRNGATSTHAKLIFEMHHHVHQHSDNSDKGHSCQRWRIIMLTLDCCAASGNQPDPDIIQHQRSGAVLHVHCHADVSCRERAAHQATPPARCGAHQWADHHHQLWGWLARWHSDHQLEWHCLNSAQIHCPWHLQSHGKICRYVQFCLSGYRVRFS